MFTVSVTVQVAMDSGPDPAELMEKITQSLSFYRITDAAVTMSDFDLSFTGQVVAPNAYLAMIHAGDVLALLGYTQITAIEVNEYEEESYAGDLRIASA